ncbi:MAG: NUDIX domain-containing protein [Spirochaetales bacterium]|jgi:8-oxo-dGTP pyrophosphatase MutT (NUDIX family)|nr:NUDIX domain-containing protein [Spirochaetales bacterium]
MELIKAQKNPFGGVVIESADLPSGGADFAARLEYSIGVWKAEGAKVVWLAAARAQAALIPAAVALGFVFHHAQEDVLQMTLTLIPGSFIPPYATHYVGAGGVVLRGDGQLLVVSERYKQFPGRRLKLPGGALQTGENIGAAVVREVKEETGIQARFESVICLRHWHGYRYGKSDIYFVCRLTPLSTEITMDTGELVECLWLPVEEYLADADVHPFNKLVVRAAMNSKGISEKFIPEYKPETYELLVP